MVQHDSDEWFDELGSEMGPPRTVSKPLRIGMIAAALLVVVGLYVGSEFPNSIASTIIYVLAGMCFVGGILFGSATLYVRERGLIWKRRSCKPIVVRYADIDRMYIPDVMVTTTEKPIYRVKLLTPNRPGIYLGQFTEADVQPIVTTLNQVVIPNLATQFYVEMQAGASIDFGDVQATQQGLQYQQLPIVAWRDIREYQFSAMGFRIYARNRPMATMQIRGNIMNVPILMFLIDIMPKLTANVDAENPASSPKSMPARTTGSEGEQVIMNEVESPATAVGYAETDPKLGAFLCGLPGSKTFKMTMILGSSLLGIGIFLLALFSEDPTLQFFGTIAFGFGAVALLLVFTSMNQGIAVYELGIMQVKKRLAWDEIERLRFFVTEVNHYGTSNRTIALKVSGARTTIRMVGTTLPIESICQEIHNQAKAVMVPKMLQLIENGGSFEVGSIKLTRDGIRSWRWQIPFARISHFEIVSNKLLIFERDESKPTFRVAATETNFPVLTGVLAALQSSGTLAVEPPPILANEEG